MTLREMRLLLQDAEQRLGPNAFVSISPDGVNRHCLALLSKQGGQEPPELLILPLDAAIPDRTKLKSVAANHPATSPRTDANASILAKTTP